MNVCPKCKQGVLVALTRRSKRVLLDPKPQAVFKGFDGFTLKDGVADYVDAFDQAHGAKHGAEAFPLHKCGNLRPAESRAAMRARRGTARVNPSTLHGRAGYDTQAFTTKGYGRP